MISSPLALTSSVLGPNSSGPSASSGVAGKDWINVRRDVKDPYYRYKMPPVRSKIEGKGNGIKTVIVNCVDISRALARPPGYVTKYFGGELGTIVHCDDKAARYIVNGAHEAEKLQDILDGFIRRFVLCGECENPETDLQVSARSQQITKQCKACGQRTAVDMGHRLVPFVLKNPPPRPAKVKVPPSDMMVEATDEQQQSGGDKEIVGMPASAADFDSLSPDRPEHMNSLEKEEDEDWAEEAAERVRRQELEGLSQSVKSALKLGDQDPLEDFADWLKENCAASDAAIQTEIANRPFLEPTLAIVVVVQTLFDVDDGLAAYGRRLPLLQGLVTSPDEQLALLYSLERLVGKHRRVLLPQLPALLQVAYTGDIVDEDALVHWARTPSRRYASRPVAQEVRAVARPFVDWLLQGEEEEEEGDYADDVKEGDE
jgi:translation initiation factor 5